MLVAWYCSWSLPYILLLKVFLTCLTHYCSNCSSVYIVFVLSVL
jgi:hypothetical protein